MLLMKNCSLRPANPADWPAIEALLLANKLPTEGAREHLNTYLLAVADGEIAGVAGAEVYGNLALMRSVAVRPGLHRQGIGRLLVEQLIDEARRRDIARLFLLTVTAPEYFAQYGFKRGPIELAPQALKASAELQGACPACAAFMSLTLHEPRETRTDLPVAVIGAGPVGLAAVAHLLERHIEPLVFEAGPTVGTSLIDYGHVRLFSPWRYNLDQAMVALLAASGWQAPPLDALPLAGEVVERVLEPFANMPAVASTLRLNTKVLAITREGFDKVKTVGRDSAPYVIRAIRDGVTAEFRVRAVIDASGTWGTPNPVGASGLPALGERDHTQAIFYGIPDLLGASRERYAGQRTLVVGAGHSAANTLLALAELARSAADTRVVWAVRSPSLDRVFGGGEADALPARGQLGAALKTLRDSGQMEFIGGIRITEIKRQGHTLSAIGLDAAGERVAIIDIDQIVCATGQRPDLTISGELRLELDPWLESSAALGELIDPNLHSCGSVRPHGHRELAHPEVGFYTVGVKSYGRAPTFLLMTGYEQARSVVAAIAGDLAAADRVELQLPETGVCSVGEPASASNASGCCGPSTAVPRVIEIAALAPAAAACCAPSTSAASQRAPCCG